MIFLLTLFAAAILFVLCWPLALLLLCLWPLLWLLSIPFRILGFAVGGLLAFIRALFYLPARILGHRSRA